MSALVEYFSRGVVGEGGAKQRSHNISGYGGTSECLVCIMCLGCPFPKGSLEAADIVNTT